MDMTTIIIIAVGIGIVIFMLGGKEENVVEKRLSNIKNRVDKNNSEGKVKEDTSVSFLMSAVAGLAQSVKEKSKDTLLQKQLLSEAGLQCDDEALLKHTSKKILYAGVITVVAFVLLMGKSDPMMKIVTLLIGPILGFRFPDIVLKGKAKKRAEEVTYTLPDAIDLLSVCVEAGLGLDSALSRVAKEQQKNAPILATEFDKVTKEILAGIPRSDAFRNLIKRNGSQELRSFVSLLIQSDKLGTSISNSLRIYSDALRIKRRQKAEELAAKAGIKMSIPLVLFILPATFIVILAPAAISMFKMFTGANMNGP